MAEFLGLSSDINKSDLSLVKITLLSHNVAGDTIKSVKLLYNGDLNYSFNISIGGGMIETASSTINSSLGMMSRALKAGASASSNADVKSALDMAGSVGFLSISNKGNFGGVDPISMNIPCFLAPLGGDYMEEVIKPLRQLLLMCMPVKSKDFSSEKLGKELNNMFDNVSKNESLGAFSDVVSGLGKFITNAALSYLGNMYLLSVPLSASVENTVSVEIGKFFLEDVMITGVNISMPRILSFDGYPEYIKIDLSVKTSRGATFDIFKNFVGNEYNDKVGDSLTQGNAYEESLWD